ncbi:hypothetical protein HY640_01960 [Candidatus Woesearchaeota archaeon]|nr:hypothetical protein [Candidatus Woesearchaeota archaeon]
MPRVRLDLPAGHAGKRAMNGVKSGLESLYHELRQDDSSFSKDLAARVRDYRIQDKELGISGSIRDVARKNGLDRELERYISQKVVGGLKGSVAYALDLVTSVKDGLEDVVEVGELAATAVGAAAGAGAGGVVVQVGSKAVKVPLYVATQTAYSVLAGILGYASGTYEFTGQGTRNYFVDVAKGYVGAFGSAVPVLGSVLELGTNLDDKRPRIAEAASRRAEVWLVNRLREKRGLPLVDAGQRDLEWLVRSGAKRVGEGRQALADYASKVRGPVYGSDVGSSQYPVLKAV